MMMYRPLWAEIDLGALRHNFTRIQQCAGKGIAIAATIKQAAYGHGLIPVARELARAGADFFAVESIEEAIILRHNHITKPILILTAVLPQYAHAFIRYRLTALAVDIDFIRSLDACARKKNTIAPVHIKIDTGMGRLGLDYRQAIDFIKKVACYPGIRIEGICTHLPVADTDTKFTAGQIAAFDACIHALQAAGITSTYTHCANSAGIIGFSSARCTMVRPGLALYGIEPIPAQPLGLKPVLSLKSKVVFIKEMPRGTSVGYGRAYRVKKPTRIATAAIGYADGYPWALSNKGNVLIKGARYPVAGRVCMDHIMIDIGMRAPIAIGDEVVLIGCQGKKRITAQQVADWAKTIPYEIVSHISFRLPRIYINANTPKQ